MSRRRKEKQAKKVLSHVDDQGHARMVDVSEKDITERTAIAHGTVKMHPNTLEAIMDKRVPKGNVIEVARVAGIVAAKKTSDLIPMCHPLNLTHVHVQVDPVGKDRLGITAEVKVTAKTGVEVEALTAVTVTALTIYDMCKSMDRAIIITDVRLLEKHGGASGDYVAESL